MCIYTVIIVHYHRNVEIAKKCKRKTNIPPPPHLFSLCPCTFLLTYAQAAGYSNQFSPSVRQSKHILFLNLIKPDKTSIVKNKNINVGVSDSISPHPPRISSLTLPTHYLNTFHQQLGYDGGQAYVSYEHVFMYEEKHLCPYNC